MLIACLWMDSAGTRDSVLCNALFFGVLVIVVYVVRQIIFGAIHQNALVAKKALLIMYLCRCIAPV